MKFVLDVELKDGRYCNGCGCIAQTERGHYCGAEDANPDSCIETFLKYKPVPYPPPMRGMYMAWLRPGWCPLRKVEEQE